MGFGFNLFAAFILLPFSLLLVLGWLLTRKKAFGLVLGFIWLGVIGLVLLVTILQFLTKKKELQRDDIYGEYIIDRTKFPGKQADWQYNHFRFEITKSDSIFFHVTDKEKINQTIKGTISFSSYSSIPGLIITMQEPGHHIMEEKPTLYRQAWSFYYVFCSPKFGNVFFTKGKWKPLD